MKRVKRCLVVASLVLLVVMNYGCSTTRTKTASIDNMQGLPRLGVYLSDISGIADVLRAESPDLRILHIQANRADVEVMTGVIRKPNVGEGVTYTLEESNGKWVIVKKTHWVM